MAEHIGYVTLAKRPARGTQGGYDYQPAGSVWPEREPVENHLAYCQMSAEADPERYGDVEYVMGRIVLDEGSVDE